MDKAEMFLNNQGLATYVALKWFAKSPTEIHDDIVGEARIGLWKACLTFNSDKGVRFSTYAGRCIDNQISMFLRKSKKCIDAISLETEIGDGLTLNDTLSYEPDFDARLVDNDFLESISGFKYTKMNISGMNQRQIAKRVGVSPTWICKMLQREKQQLVHVIYA